MAIFYTPDRAWLGDVIPYAENGKFYLFYLNDKRYAGRIGKETSWDLITTTDFVHFTEEGTALPIGTRSEIDNSVYTGSVFKAGEGQYHIFYTAQNNYCAKYCDENGNPIQVILHATSRDLIHWEKHTEHPFSSAGSGYTLNDWRDPFVFRDDEKNCYTMLLAAVKTTGTFHKGGCTLACHSQDLETWTIGEPLYAPDAYLTHECPDLFRLKDKWYLIFSTFTDKFLTHYRVGETCYGPWTAPQQDSLDARAYYAAKTAEADGVRYAFGWIPTREKTSDYGRYEWGGTMVVHQIVPQENGVLYVKMPDSLYTSFPQESLPALRETRGDVTEKDGEILIDATYRPGCAVYDRLPAECIIEGEMEFAEGTRAFGVALHQSEDLEDGYFYKVEPFHRRLVMDMWPRCQLPQEQVYLGGDIPMQAELERALDLNGAAAVTWKIVVDRDCAVVYVNDQAAMSTRLYNLVSNPKWGFFAIDGKATVRNVRVITRA